MENNQTVDKPISKIKLHKKTVSDKGMRCFDFGLKSYAQHDKDLNILSLENRKVCTPKKTGRSQTVFAWSGILLCKTAFSGGALRRS